MTQMSMTQALRTARNAASITLADAAGQPSRIDLYTAPAGVLLGTVTLTRPCGVLNADGRIALLPASTVDLAVETGPAAWAVWCDGAGTPLAHGPVTDEAGNTSNPDATLTPGAIGPVTLAGNEGTYIHAGGVLTLGPSLIG